MLSLSINVECDYDYHQECPSSVVGVICGPESEVRVLFPDLGLLPGNPEDRQSWVTCFLMLHLLTTLDGLVHVCIAGGPLWGDGTLASEHLFFVEPMSEALKAFRGHITFSTCSGHWSNNAACRYSTFVISSLLPTLGARYNPSCGIHWDRDREVWVNQHFSIPGLVDFSFPDTFPYPSPHLASPLDLDPSILVHTRSLCERLGLWLFPPTLLATVPNVGDLACLCRADSNALVGPLFPVPPGPGFQVWPTESGDPRLLHKWRPEHDCAQLTVFFPDGLYNPISLSPKVSSPLLPFLTRMLGTLSLPGGWMVLHGTKPLRRQTTPSELGVRAGWRFEVSVVLSGLLGGHPQSWESAWMSSRPSSPRRRLVCSPDSFFRLSPEACEPGYGRCSFPQDALLDSIPFALPLPLPIPTARVAPDSPHQPWWTWVVGTLRVLGIFPPRWPKPLCRRPHVSQQNGRRPCVHPSPPRWTFQFGTRYKVIGPSRPAPGAC